MLLSDSDFRELASIRRDFIRQLTREKSRHSQACDRELEASHTALIEALTGHIQDIDGKLEQAMRDNPSIRENSELLHSIPGLDMEMCKRLLIELPELGRVGNKQIAGLVGVAPKKNGDSRDKRGGFIRHLLHEATEAAIQKDKGMADIFNRLLEKGKPESVAIVAAMRKLLSFMNSMLHQKRPYEGHHSRNTG